jgi:photosystem II stability/assembly factor-like uncharacterized protein
VAQFTPLRVALGTEDGVRIVRVTDSGVTVSRDALSGETVRSLATAPDGTLYVGCGLRGWGAYKITGERVSQLGFEDRWVWGVTLHPTDPETVFVGTEPPALYRSSDGGEAFTELSGVTDVPSREEWEFYHDPFGDGHIHGLTIHPDQPDRLVAGVEDGPLLYSNDGGDSWSDTLPGRDVHRLAMDPADPDRWLVGTADGLFCTTDAGGSWTSHLTGEYVHGVTFDAHDPNRVWVYTAEADPVYRSSDGGQSWTAVAEDLPAARAADPLVVHPRRPDTVVYAGGEQAGRLFYTTDAGRTWERISTDLPKVWRTTPLAPA